MLNGNSQSSTGNPVVTTKRSISEVGTLWRYLLEGRVRQVIFLIFTMIAAAILEMAAIASVLPLVGSLIDSQTDSVAQASIALPSSIQVVSRNLSETGLLWLIAIIVSLSALLRIVVIRKIAEFSATVATELQSTYFRKLLTSDYEQIINQSSSENISFVTNKIQLIIRNYILSFLRTITALISAAGVIVVLAWVSNFIVLFALVTLAAAYLLIAWFSRSKIRHYGIELKHVYPKQIQFLREGLGGIRDVVMSGSQDINVKRFTETTEKVEKANAKLIFYNDFPKPLLEAIAVCSIVAIAGLVNLGLLPNKNLLPLLGAFALGMLRLLPYFQQIFGQWSKFVQGQAILSELMDTLGDFKPAVSSNTVPADSLPMPFNHSISLSNVGFSYQGVATPALKDVNLHIEKGQYIGIVGVTGSGKSTLVDILMGLLIPMDGDLEVDGVVIDSQNRSLWRKQIAHVPQKIFLSQASIAQNIAFSVAENDIDWERLERCAHLAQIDAYIQSLPLKYETQVGEDGERLSGGQRQRIGIARALYSQCSVLILDEATNALDAATELAIVEALLQQNQQYTIISVAHNLQAVSHCHRKIQLSEGNAIAIRH